MTADLYYDDTGRLKLRLRPDTITESVTLRDHAAELGFTLDPPVTGDWAQDAWLQAKPKAGQP